MVSGRGELHLSILIETLRREGYEFQVSRPEAILHREDGVLVEPVNGSPSPRPKSTWAP